MERWILVEINVEVTKSLRALEDIEPSQSLSGDECLLRALLGFRKSTILKPPYLQCHMST